MDTNDNNVTVTTTARPSRLKGPKAAPPQPEFPAEIVPAPVSKTEAAIQLLSRLVELTEEERDEWLANDEAAAATVRMLGGTVHHMVEASKPLDRRLVNSVRNLPGSATVGTVVTIGTAVASALFLKEKWDAYRAEADESDELESDE